MRGAIPPLPQYALKAQRQLYLTYGNSITDFSCSVRLRCVLLFVIKFVQKLSRYMAVGVILPLVRFSRRDSTRRGSLSSDTHYSQDTRVGAGSEYW
jgi:hypothetical protein